MPAFIKQMFIVLVLVLLCFGGSMAINCVSMNNQPCMVRPTLVDLNPSELYYYPFTIIMDRCDGSCSTVKDPGGIICVPNKWKT